MIGGMRLTAVALSALLGVTGWAPHAHAMATIVDEATTESDPVTGRAALYRLNTTCVASYGMVTAEGVVLVVQATAVASGATPALATGVTCYVRNAYSSNWGGATNGLVGPAVAAVGTTRPIPLDQTMGLQACLSANALFYPSVPLSVGPKCDAI